MIAAPRLRCNFPPGASRWRSTLNQPEPRTQRSVVFDDITLNQFLGALRRLFQKASLRGRTHSGAMVPLVPGEGTAVGVTKRYPGLLCRLESGCPLCNIVMVRLADR